MAGTAAETFAGFVDQASAAGMPVFDVVLETDFRRPRGAAVDYRTMLGSTGAELVYCAFHPCRPGEVELIDPEWWHVRTDEFERFRDVAWRARLDAQSFEVIGIRELRDEWRRVRREE